MLVAFFIILFIKPSELYDIYNIPINKIIVITVCIMFFTLNLFEMKVIINPIMHDAIIGIIGNNNSAIIDDR